MVVCVCVCVTDRVQQSTPMHEWLGKVPACKNLATRFDLACWERVRNREWESERERDLACAQHGHMDLCLSVLDHLVILSLQLDYLANWCYLVLNRTHTHKRICKDTHGWAKPWLYCFTVCYCSHGLNEIKNLFQLILLTNMCDPWLTLMWPSS